MAWWDALGVAPTANQSEVDRAWNEHSRRLNAVKRAYEQATRALGQVQTAKPVVVTQRPMPRPAQPVVVAQPPISTVRTAVHTIPVFFGILTSLDPKDKRRWHHLRRVEYAAPTATLESVLASLNFGDMREYVDASVRAEAPNYLRKGRFRVMLYAGHGEMRTRRPINVAENVSHLPLPTTLRELGQSTPPRWVAVQILRYGQRRGRMRQEFYVMDAAASPTTASSAPIAAF